MTTRIYGWQESIITADSKGKVLEFSDFLADVRKLVIATGVAPKEAAQEFRQLPDKPNTVSTVNFEPSRSRARSLNVTVAVSIPPNNPPAVPTIACKKPCECAQAIYTTFCPRSSRSSQRIASKASTIARTAI